MRSKEKLTKKEYSVNPREGHLFPEGTRFVEHEGDRHFGTLRFASRILKEKPIYTETLHSRHDGARYTRILSVLGVI
jgi:hypothetical protein